VERLIALETGTVAMDGQTGPIASDFEGSLEERGLVQAAERIGSQAAEVVCTSPGGEVATLWFRDGLLLDVQLDWRNGPPALRRLLTWPAGWFHARVGPHEHESVIAQPAGPMFLETQPQAERWAQLVRELGGLDAILEVHFATLAFKLADVPDDANGIMRLVDGQRTLRVVLDAAQLEELDTLAIVQRLCKDGVLRATESTPPARWIPEASRAVAPLSVKSVSDDEAASAAVQETPSLEAIPLSTVLSEVPLDWAQGTDEGEITAPSRLIPVVQFAGEHGSRRRRLESEASAVVAALVAQKDRATLLTREVLAPGALLAPGLTAEDLSDAAGDAFDAYFERRLRRNRALVVVIALVSIAVLSLGAQVWRARRAVARPSGALPFPSLQTPLSTASSLLPAPLPALVLPAQPAVADQSSFDELVLASQRASAAGQPGRAIELMEKASNLRKTPMLMRELGKAYYKSDQLSPAIDRLKQATVLDGRDAEAFVYLGTALQDAHRLAEAKAAYRRFLGLEPASTRRHAEVAAVLQRLERP
jgi:hypothetical protein